MTIVLTVIASILVVLGWVLSLAGISGTWIILFAGIGLDVFHDWGWDCWISTIIFAIACAGAEIIEFLSGLFGAKAFGGSKYSQIGAFLGTLGGGLVGSFAIPLPIIGTIIGVIVGGFVGALIGEVHYRKKHFDETTEGLKTGMKAGVGAMIARLFSIVVKATLSTLMIAWFIWVAYHNLSS